MASNYTVERHLLGILVRGSVPVGDFAALAGVWEQEGFRYLSVPVAEALRGTAAVVRVPEDGVKWLASLGYGPDNPDWLKSGDTGISSKTIFAVLAKRPSVIAVPEMSHPRDADDFGRCFRLLKRFPEWRPRLMEVAEVCKSFEPIVRCWDELASLFEAGRFAEVSALIQRICAR